LIKVYMFSVIKVG